MNRAERRDFIRQAQQKGVSEETAEAYIALREAGVNKVILPNKIKEGTAVSVNIEQIKARKDYSKLNPKYTEFVESSAGKIFTAHIENGNLISLEEQPEWLFWSGDLIPK